MEENDNKQPAHETQTDIENHAFCAQPSNKSIISKQITYEPLVTVTINIVLQTLVTVFLSGVSVGEIYESKNDFCLSFLKIGTVKHETQESNMRSRIS